MRMLIWDISVYIYQLVSFFRGLDYYIKWTDTLWGEVTLSKLFSFPYEKESTLKEKNLLPLGANSFLLEWTPFQKGLGMRKANRKY